MNILFTRFPLESRLGGAEVQTISLLEGLRTRNHEVAFLGSCETLLSLCREQRILARAVRIGPPPVSAWLAISFLWRQAQMKKQLEAEILFLHAQKPLDAVCMLSLTEKLLLTRSLTKKGIKVMWIEHDRVGRWLRLNPWLPRLRRFSRLATTVCVSELSRQIYLKLSWLAERTVAIPNGVDEARFPAVASVAKDKLIGCIARLSEDKGVDLLIEAVAVIPNAHLSIIGSGPEEEALRTLIEERLMTDRVTISSKVDDLNGFYRSLAVLVLPSREHDPFGLVAAEALLCGVPVIVTDACGIAGYLRDGSDALVVPANDERALAAAILKVLNDPRLRETIGNMGRQTAQAKFRLGQMVDGYEQLLKT